MELELVGEAALTFGRAKELIKEAIKEAQEKLPEKISHTAYGSVILDVNGNGDQDIDQVPAGTRLAISSIFCNAPTYNPGNKFNTTTGYITFSHKVVADIIDIFPKDIGTSEVPTQSLTASGSVAAPAAGTTIATILGANLSLGLWKITSQMLSTSAEGANSANGRLSLGGVVLANGIYTTQCCPPADPFVYRLPVNGPVGNLTLGTGAAANLGTIFALLSAEQIAGSYALLPLLLQYNKFSAPYLPAGDKLHIKVVGGPTNGIVSTIVRGFLYPEDKR